MAVGTTEVAGTLGRVSDALADLAGNLLESVVLVRSGHGDGSGVIWESDGLIVTNSHVVRGNAAVVVLHDGRRLEGRVVSRDPRRDLAALRVDAHGLPAVEVADSGSVRPGQPVLAVGNPLGMRGVITQGVVIGTAPSPGGRSLIHADVSLAPGNSGGPLADLSGRVLGINSMVGPSGVAMAVPSAEVERFLSESEALPSESGSEWTVVPVVVRWAGRVVEGFLVTGLGEELARSTGLMQGDVVLDHPGRWLRRAGAAPLRVLRGGRLLELIVPPRERSVA